MTVYALAKYNRYFSKGAALSPSLWVSSGDVSEFIKNGKFGKGTILYTDYGSKEFKNHDVQKKVFRDACAELIDKDVLLTSCIVPNGTHSEASWEGRIPFFMNALGFQPEN